MGATPAPACQGLLTDKCLILQPAELAGGLPGLGGPDSSARMQSPWVRAECRGIYRHAGAPGRRSATPHAGAQGWCR